MKVDSVIILSVVFAWFTLMILAKKINMDSFKEFIEVVNSRGGNIIVLLALSIMFFRNAVNMFYWVIDKAVDGKISVDNAMVLAGWTFMTGTAFGGSFSSMLTMMTGSGVKNGNGTPPPAPVATPVPAPVSP